MNKFRDKEYFFTFPIAEQIAFAKRLAVLTQAGLPLLGALAMLQKQAASKASAKILGHLHKQVENGRPLFAAMGEYQKYFGNFAVSLVRVGELSGTLNDNLIYLAEELRKKQELKRKIVGALVYPGFIITATVGITALLTTYVFPKIMPVFQSFNFPLPWSTRVLITLSNLMRGDWYIILSVIVGIAAGIYFLLRRPAVRLWFDRFCLRLPLLGSMFRAYQVANFTRTLGLLLKSDARIVEALGIVGLTCGNSAYRDKFATLASGAARGEKISTLLAQDPLLFPPVLWQMAEVGEATGKLSDSLIYVSGMYEDELNDIAKNLSTSIEPALMIFMGLLVGFIAISIITPIYGLTQSLHP